MTVQAENRGVPAIAVSSESDDRLRAKTISIGRRRRQFMLNVAIRIVSLFSVLTIWEIFGARVDQSLFTTPIAIAEAAVEMVGQRGIVGLSRAQPGRAGHRPVARGRGRRTDRPGAGAVLGGRCRVRGLHHFSLFDSERRAGAAHRVVGRLRHHRQDHHPVSVRLLPHGHQHLSGREKRRSQAHRGRPLVPVFRTPAMVQHRVARAPCRSSSPVCGSRSDAD